VSPRGVTVDGRPLQFPPILRLMPTTSSLSFTTRRTMGGSSRRARDRRNRQHYCLGRLYLPVDEDGECIYCFNLGQTRALHLEHRMPCPNTVCAMRSFMLDNIVSLPKVSPPKVFRPFKLRRKLLGQLFVCYRFY
jgi:hypothetical protein